MRLVRTGLNAYKSDNPYSVGFAEKHFEDAKKQLLIPFPNSSSGFKKLIMSVV